jgi:hypothetical protein
MNQDETYLNRSSTDRREVRCLNRSHWSAKKLVTLAAMFFAAGCAQLPAEKSAPEAVAVQMRPDQVIAAFSANPTGGLPRQWYPMVIFRNKKQTQYQLVTDQGKTVLHAVAATATSGLMQHVDLDPSIQPWLSWDWKIGRLVRTSDNERHITEDSPARIILGFDGDKDMLPFSDQIMFETARAFTGYDFPYATLMYIWDKNAPVGTIMPSNRSGRIKMLVVANGADSVGEWRGFTRNIVEDFERAYGEKPGKLIGVGVLTDTDNIGETAETWYGDIRLRPGRN